MSDLYDTFPIEGIPISSDIKPKTKTIPYAPGMPVRREIGQLYPPQDDLTKKQWTLFVLALEAFKAMPVDETLSYFQIAGIHGYPETSWDEAPEPPKDPKKHTDPLDPTQQVFYPGQDPNGGYCHHNMISFPTWHRPYMLLFENRLWWHMTQQIEEWVKTKVLSESEGLEWTDAAKQWRLPYWDWARRQAYNGEFSLPLCFTKKRVPIYLPSGEVKYPNPLWGFDNPEKDADDEPRAFGDMPTEPVDKSRWNIRADPGVAPWNKCSGVSRYGLTRITPDPYAKNPTYLYSGLDGTNNFDMANFFMDNFADNWYREEVDNNSNMTEQPGSNLPDALNRMFSPKYNSTWGTFATTKWYSEGATDMSTGYLSLEYIHNNVHNLSGGSDFTNGGVGHMCDVPVAAFDPLFWMHHCMIDRLLSIWQVINWDLWWDKKESKTTQFKDPSPDDPLQPFHKDTKGSVWTSTESRDWTKLNYSYDDLKPQPDAIDEDGSLNEKKYIDDLKQHIQDIYPCTADVVKSVYRDVKVQNPDFFGPKNAEKGVWNDFLINVIYDRYALNGRSYNIEFWLGDDPNKRAEKIQATKIGHVYSLGGFVPQFDTTPGCKNCGSQKDNKVLSRAQVPITIHLMKQALDSNNEAIQSTLKEEVEAYLKKHLHWRFVGLGGDVMDAREFPNTKIAVLAGTGRTEKHVEHDHRDHPPTYGGYQIMYEVTSEKEGGVKRDDELLGEGKTNYRDIE